MRLKPEAEPQNEKARPMPGFFVFAFYFSCSQIGAWSEGFSMPRMS